MAGATSGAAGSGRASVADRVELRALVDAYAFGLDRRCDPEPFCDLWVEDGVLVVEEDGAGSPPTATLRLPRDVGRMFDRLATYARTMHAVTTHQVTLDGDDATGTAYCEAHHVSVAGGGHVDKVLWIRYTDRYRFDRGVWRFAVRTVGVLHRELRVVELLP